MLEIIKEAIPTYEEAMEHKEEIKNTKRFIAFREYTGNYKLDAGWKKGLGLKGALEYCKHREEWKKGTHLYRPFGYFGSRYESTEGIYRKLVETSIEDYNGEESVYSMFMRGFVFEAKKRGLNVSGESTEKRHMLFFSWLAGCCKGIEIERIVIEKLNKTSSARNGWVYERAEGHYEAKDVDIVGTKDGRKFYISVKAKGGAFSESCVRDYRELQGRDLPHAYLNEELECRKADDLSHVFVVS